METDPLVTPPLSPFSANIAGPESSGNVTAENPLFPVSRGGPLGAHQFIASTWMDFAKNNPQLFAGMSPDQILAARANPRLSAQATDWYAAQNAKVLDKNGITPSASNLGIAHTLGPAGAVGVLKYGDSTPLSQAFKETQPNLADAILRQNPSYAKMTVGDLKSKYAHFDTGTFAPPGTPTAGTAPNETAQVTPFYPMPGGVNGLSPEERQQRDALNQLQTVSALMNMFKGTGNQSQANPNAGLLQALALAAQTGRGNNRLLTDTV